MEINDHALDHVLKHYGQHLLYGRMNDMRCSILKQKAYKTSLYYSFDSETWILNLKNEIKINNYSVNNEKDDTWYIGKKQENEKLDTWQERKPINITERIKSLKWS